MSDPAAPLVTVLGIGNTIMGDDGIGPDLLERLIKVRGHDPRIEFVDGGIQGMELLPVVQDAHSLLILDAVAPGRLAPTPGAAVRLAGDQVPRLLASKLSPHQVGLLDVLGAARLLGREPERVAAVGVVGVDVDLRIGLTDAVIAALPEAVRLAEDVLDEWLAE